MRFLPPVFSLSSSSPGVVGPPSETIGKKLGELDETFPSRVYCCKFKVEDIRYCDRSAVCRIQDRQLVNELNKTFLDRITNVNHSRVPLGQTKTFIEIGPAV
ncbi:hypothetical protein TNCV_3646501 [Trichonephila clavipes]|nr:hypothetical protein TNCV_3646501 [Trichonephila clavipes]